LFDINLYRIPLRRPPDACATLSGDSDYPSLHGTVLFYQTNHGVLMVTQVSGLPQGNYPCASNVYGFHIHEGGPCMGTEADPFADAGAHYNPGSCPHPAHAGDLPPLFGNRGSAFMVHLTDRFSVCEVIGRTVIIHNSPDDFTTQPSGNSGKKIACGQIRGNFPTNPC